MESNKVLLELGAFGKWQVRNYILFCLSVMFPPAWHIVSLVYIGFKPEHHCKVPSNIPLNQSIPTIDGKLSSCFQYKNFSVNDDIIPCTDGWTYLGDDGPTIVTKWDLVCDNSHLAQLPQTSYLIGCIFGSIFFSWLSDKIGRKDVFFFCHWSSVVVGVVLAFSPNLTVFLIGRSIMGFTCHSILIVGFILTCESFAAPHRTFVGTIIENFWAMALCTMPLAAFILKNWVHLQLFLSLAGILTVPLYWLLPESVLWLELNGRTDEAEKIFQKAAKMNKINLPNPIFPPQKVEDKNKFRLNDILHFFKGMFKSSAKSKADEANHIYTTKHLFLNKTLRKHLLLTSMLWLVVILVYFAFLLTTAQLAGNHYLNGFLGGLMEIPAYIVSYFSMIRFGRRYSLIGFQIVSGVALLLQIIVSKVPLGNLNSAVFVVIFNMIGRLGISGAYGSLDLYAPELFPTALRNQAQGIASVFGRMGTIAASFLPYILEKNDWAPLVVLVVMIVLGCFFVMLLPETIHRDLPHSIEDIESWTIVVPKMVVESEEEMEVKKENGEKVSKRFKDDEKKDKVENGVKQNGINGIKKSGVINATYMKDKDEDLGVEDGTEDSKKSETTTSL